MPFIAEVAKGQEPQPTTNLLKAVLAMLKDPGQLFRCVVFNRTRPVVPRFQAHSACV